MPTFQCSDIPPKDYPQITKLIAASSRYQGLLLRQAAANPAQAGGWWYGAYSNGEVQAFSWMANNTAQIYAPDEESARALGTSMLRAASTRTGSGGTHSLFGAESVLNPFWESFKLVKRTLVGDHHLNLHSIKAAPATPEGYAARFPTAKDQKILEELAGEQAVEEWGVDPRRSAKVAHEASCRELIDKRLALIGTQGAKNVFFCARHSPVSDAMMLERLHVPVAFRRPRVLAGVLAHAAALCFEGAKPEMELLCFVDRSREPWMQACKEVGFETVSYYRLIKLR